MEPCFVNFLFFWEFLFLPHPHYNQRKQHWLFFLQFSWIKKNITGTQRDVGSCFVRHVKANTRNHLFCCPFLDQNQKTGIWFFWDFLVFFLHKIREVVESRFIHHVEINTGTICIFFENFFTLPIFTRRKNNKEIWFSIYLH